MISEEINDLYNLIIRTKDYKNLPDVENYVRELHKNNYFKNLIEEKKFTLEEIKKQPFTRLCDIFFRKEKQSLETGDIIIFKKSGNYQVFLKSQI